MKGKTNDFVELSREITLEITSILEEIAKRKTLNGL